MTQVDVQEAKTRLSRLLRQAEAGEDVVIARAGTPVVRLVPMPRKLASRRRFGSDAGVFTVPDDFDDPMRLAAD